MIVTRIVWLLVSAILLASSYTHAQTRRPYTSEFSFRFNYVEEERFDGANGSYLDVKDDLGFGFSYLYNQSEHLAIGGSFDWIGMNYTAFAKAQDPENDDFTYRNKMYNYSLNFDVVYYLLKKPFTPFVSGSLGWTTIDTNIPSGPSYDYWWCDYYGCWYGRYQPTKSESGFNYKVGLGLRWDVNRDFAIKGAYQWSEVDIDVPGDAPIYNTWRLELISKFY